MGALEIFLFVILILGSYFLGNLNSARILSKKQNQDITKQGSGNPGTMNMLRTFGIKQGVLTLVLDVIKSAIPAATGFSCLAELRVELWHILPFILLV